MLEKMPKILYHIYMKASSNQLNNHNAQNGGMLYSFLVVCVFFISLIYSLIPESWGIKSVIVGYCLGPIAVLLAIVLLRVKVKNSLIAPLFPIKSNLWVIVSTALIFVGLTFGLANLNVYFASWLESLGVSVSEPSMPEFSPLNLALIIITACVLPAFFEELAFRGIIVNSLKGTGAVFTAIASGLAFALFHMSPTQTLYQFACGVVYALIVVCGGSFIHTFVIHLLNNLFVILNYYFFAIQTSVPLTIIGALCLAGGIALLLIKNKPEKTEKSLAKGERISFVLSAFVGIAIAIAFWVQGLLL